LIALKNKKQEKPRRKHGNIQLWLNLLEYQKEF
jgi:hypothetical protein